MYTITGITYETLTKLHDFYLSRTIITSSLWDNKDKSYTITITENAMLKIRDGNITIDLGAKLYTIERGDYVSLEVM